VAVARLIEKKGLPDLIAAAARLQRRGVEAQVRIVGDGPQREELRTLMHELGTDGSVELLGPRDPVEVHAILEAADLLVMPCVVAANGDRDTMPVVVKEALAMELPVVATDEVGLPEMVKPRWGRLVPPRSPDALADAIEEMLAMSPDTRAEMGRAGREFVLAECNLTRETERLVELVRSARG
jgi:glycosyltransferase involved in cell wall biosynthesis